MLEDITNWVIFVGSASLLVLAIMSWLLSFRAPRAAPAGSRGWFLMLPVWAQIAYGFFACALLRCLGRLLWIPVPLIVSSEAADILRIIGLAIFLPGWLLVLWARCALGAMYGVSTSFAAQLQVRHRLVQSGPYAVVRHPMYFGYWLLLLSVAVVYRTWTPIVFLAMCVPSFCRRARREETALAQRFGDEWQTYAARTSFLIPFVW